MLIYCNIGKILKKTKTIFLVTHNKDYSLSPQIRLYASNGNYPSNHNEAEYPLLAYYIENSHGDMNFRSGTEHIIGEESPSTKVTFLNNGNKIVFHV